MIINFKIFENLYENEEGDVIVVAINNNDYGIIKGHRYIVIDGNETTFRIKDIYNNMIMHNCHKKNYVSENEYIYGEITKKYNI